MKDFIFLYILIGLCLSLIIGLIFYWCNLNNQNTDNEQVMDNCKNNLPQRDNLINNNQLQQNDDNDGNNRISNNNNNHEKDKIGNLSQKNVKKLSLSLKKIYINNFERNSGIVFFVVPSMIQFSDNEIKVIPYTSNIFLI